MRASPYGERLRRRARRAAGRLLRMRPRFWPSATISCMSARIASLSARSDARAVEVDQAARREHAERRRGCAAPSARTRRRARRSARAGRPGSTLGLGARDLGAEALHRALGDGGHQRGAAREVAERRARRDARAARGLAHGDRLGALLLDHALGRLDQRARAGGRGGRSLRGFGRGGARGLRLRRHRRRRTTAAGAMQSVFISLTRRAVAECNHRFHSEVRHATPRARLGLAFGRCARATRLRPRTLTGPLALRPAATSRSRSAPCGAALCGTIVRVLSNKSMADPSGRDEGPARARPGRAVELPARGRRQLRGLHLQPREPQDLQLHHVARVARPARAAPVRGHLDAGPDAGLDARVTGDGASRRRTTIRLRRPSSPGIERWLNSGPLTLLGAARQGRARRLLDGGRAATASRRCRTWSKWYETYAPQGLVVVGVHTPESPYEALPETRRQGRRSA